MEIKCGVDIVEIKRIKKNVDIVGENFINRIYTQKERQYCESKNSQKYQHYAGRFAAKEAAFKAISEKLDGKYTITWKDIEVTNDKDGRPKIHIAEMEKYNIENIDVSISHCREYAIANVVILYN